MFMEPAGLSDQPCDAMADNTVSHLLTDGNPDPVLSQSVTAQIEDEVLVYKRFSGIIAIFKIRVLLQRFHNLIRFVSNFRHLIVVLAVHPAVVLWLKIL